MATKILDYAHLYIGCEVEVDQTAYNGSKHIWTLVGVEIKPDCVFYIVLRDGNYQSFHNTPIKFILRPLSDMTDDERSVYLELNTTRENKEQCEANYTVYLLSKSFDLFSLIQSGEAIDKTTLK